MKITTFDKLFGGELRQLCVCLLFASGVSFPSIGSATHTDTLANSPLFIGNTVQPNVFFMLDDSGSMDWETLYNDGTGQDNSSGRDIDLSPDTATERLLLCRGYNTMAYDPNVTYTPWRGQDSASALYANASTFTAVRRNPYCAAVTGSGLCSFNSGTVNLTSGVVTYAYFPWTDSDNDGQYDAGECDTSDAGGVTWAELASTGTTNVPASEQQQNFANWYSYYRKREYVLKRAVSELIKTSQYRVGLATLWNNNSVGTPIANIDDITTPVNATAATNKTNLLSKLSQIYSNNGTPLRDSLDAVGNYYEGISQTRLFGAAPSHTTTGSEGTVSALSPILSAANGGQCQQNFTILMTDGYYNSGYSGTNVGNADGNQSTTFDSGNSGTAARPYGDNQSNTLGDIAMHYYERDLWVDSMLADNVPVVAGVDNASHQHMVTFTVAFGLTGNLDPFGTKTTSAADTDPNNTSFAWPNQTPAAMEDTQDAIDDLWHAAYNGRGKFLSARSPTALIQSISDAIGAIDDRTGSAASVAVNSRTLNTTTRVYQARFTSGEWSGDLRALPITATGDVGTEIWSAKERVKLQDWSTGRTILTRRNTTAVGACAAGTGSNAGIPFRWTDLSTTQQCALNINPATSAADSEGSARLEYLRGSSANEGQGNNYRVRKNGFKLGDIIDSTPIHVGAPPILPDLETIAHSTFREANVSRRQMIYVGANDGMLHGFDAATGDEKIAYVPSMVFANLNRLTDPAYVHRNYVNASPTVGDAFFGGAWHTMLVSGLGHGGKGYFALDVTDPDGTTTPTLALSEANAANIVKWEFTDSGTPNDMGFSYSQPVIARMKNGDWAAIFGNGYNSVNERPVLYIVKVSDGTILSKIILDTTTGGRNGLSTPAVIDQNGDYVADYIFAGDLKGNMWKIDVTGNSPASWGSFYTKSGSPAPLYKANDGTSPTPVVQPITSSPEIGPHPDNLGGFMVYFGTGKYLEDGDRVPNSSPVNTFYGIWDKPVSSGAITGSATAAVTRNDLLPQTLDTASVAGTTARSVTNTPITWRTGSSGSCPSDGSGTCLGWRVDLKDATSPVIGEMSVSNPVLIGGTLPRIIFTTLIPETAASCSFGGTSWLMELNPRNGGRFSEALLDVNGDATYDLISAGNPAVGMKSTTGILSQPVVIRDPANNKIIKGLSGSTGAITTNKQKGGTKPDGARIGWRQLK